MLVAAAAASTNLLDRYKAEIRWEEEEEEREGEEGEIILRSERDDDDLHQHLNVCLGGLASQLSG